MHSRLKRRHFISFGLLFLGSATQALADFVRRLIEVNEASTDHRVPVDESPPVFYTEASIDEQINELLLRIERCDNH